MRRASAGSSPDRKLLISRIIGMPEKIIFYGFPLRLNFPKMFFFYDKCNISGKETKADA